MDATIARELHARIDARLLDLGFDTQPNSVGNWAARRAVHANAFGRRAVTYCISCRLDGQTNVVYLSDAMLETRCGATFACKSAAKLSNCIAVRAEIEQLAQSVGWRVERTGRVPGAQLPSVFKL